MQGSLIVNPRSGDDDPSGEELAAAARERGIEVRLLEQGDDIAGLARDAEAGPIGMAGGDGSLSLVAQV